MAVSDLLTWNKRQEKGNQRKKEINYLE
ncbi:hypothetical protein E2C01_092163 [Portunus trituberculatus]|uniref:Uncharacterized protein n=1 Tax=Portunus trituberculatus TaxID=210409 RepID=A0A5B7JR08_PORTR|nr:hypothetical protein [Portunus trituberculatus]